MQRLSEGIYPGLVYLSISEGTCLRRYVIKGTYDYSGEVDHLPINPLPACPFSLFSFFLFNDNYLLSETTTFKKEREA